MNDQLFEELLGSIKEAGGILRGTQKASRERILSWPDAAAARQKLGMTQDQFAAPHSSKLGAGASPS